jgi:DNA-binding NarL/FixJ family response regulator
LRQVDVAVAVSDAVPVVVVDDDGEMRVLLRTLLERGSQFNVVGEAADGSDALALIADNAPEVVILDLGLPDVTGLDLIPQIHELAPRARVVVFSGSDFADARALARERGAAEFVVKGDAQRLVDAIRDLTQRAAELAQRWFPAAPTSARAARRFIRAQCQQWNCGDVAEQAELIASELVTNAVIHAQSAFEVRLRRDEQVLRIEVADKSTDAPDPREPDESSESGRGMFLVSSMSHAWGVDPQPPGKIVWAEFAL